MDQSSIVHMIEHMKLPDFVDQVTWELIVDQLGSPQFGSAKGMITMADDFDAPLEDFREYMEHDQW